MTAARGGDAPVVKLLLSAKANVNHANKVSQSSVILCEIVDDYISMVREMIKFDNHWY
jgi:ankyrin repeat protein